MNFSVRFTARVQTTEPLNHWTTARKPGHVGQRLISKRANSGRACERVVLVHVASPLIAAVVLCEPSGVNQRWPGCGRHIRDGCCLHVAQGLWFVRYLTTQWAVTKEALSQTPICAFLFSCFGKKVRDQVRLTGGKWCQQTQMELIHTHRNKPLLL